MDVGHGRDLTPEEPGGHGQRAVCAVSLCGESGIVVNTINPAGQIVGYYIDGRDSLLEKLGFTANGE